MSKVIINKEKIVLSDQLQKSSEGESIILRKGSKADFSPEPEKENEDGEQTLRPPQYPKKT